jgi:integrase
MPSGACAYARHGKRGTAWAIRWLDAAGETCHETLGREPQWNRQRAERELGKRLDLVERERWRKPAKLTFEAFTKRFRADYLPGRNLKPSTFSDYGSIIDAHLVPHFGTRALASIEPADVDGYIGVKTGALTPKTISNHLQLLAVMFKVAKRWKLLASNPLEDVDRPRPEHHEMSVLTEAEVARLLTAYRELELEPPKGTAAEWWRLTRRMVEVALATAMRRGEVLALRWRDVELLEGRLRVREAIVRGKFGAPKSRTSNRTIELGPRTVAVLQDVWRESRYRTDECLVFPHPTLGTPLDPSKVSRDYMRTALARAKITKPFRPWHDLRHTALTHEAAAGNPQVYVQLKAGHSQGSITERYLHAAQVMFPGAAERGEERIFGGK